jgi:RHS repeat-associated protein
MIDPSGSETYTYNKLGQTTQDAKVIGSATYTTQYAYNTGGELTQITYPSTHVVYQSYDAIGRLCEVAGSTISTACGTATTPYVSTFGYNAASELTGLTYGNGVGASIGYSPDRLQMTSLSYAKSGTTLFGLTYAHGTSGSNNGQISGITDSMDTGRSTTYTYDALARISTARTTGSTGYPQWGLSFTYDRYGNRTAETQTAGSPPSNSVAVSTTTNRITTSGYSYDLSGNTTNDGYSTLVYDGENRATSATNGNAAGTYTYDGKGLRVEKVSGSTTAVYIFSGNLVIAEYDNGAAPASPTNEYIYAGDQKIAVLSGGSIAYFHNDHLSVRMRTDPSGNVLDQRGHFPFGETWYLAPTGAPFVFTTYSRDAESGNDYAMARYDVDRLGRFNSPDPIGGSSGDPQSLNRYAYVENDPINAADPSGLCPRDDSWVLPSTVYAMNHGGVGKLVCSTPAVYYFGSGAGYYDGFGGDPFTDPFNVLGDPFFGEPLPSDPSGVPWNTGCESLGMPCGMSLPTGVGPDLSNCTYGSGYCGGGIYGFNDNTEAIILKKASDFSAGAGDALSLGLTFVIRKYVYCHCDDVVDKGSGAYITGAVTGTAISTAIGATGGALADGKYGALFGRGGGFFNRGPFRFGWSWEGSATAGRDVIRLGIGAARGTSWWSHIPFYYP